MSDPRSIDGVLVQWGERLFYPANRMVKGQSQPRLSAFSQRRRAAEIRARIAAALRRAPQVMVKVTGGGRGMKAIAAHFKYIAKGGRLELETDHGEKLQGREALRDLAEEWRLGGTPIDDVGFRREALNIMLSMPRGIDPLTVQRAAREFATQELADHKYVMVLHDHQANPHVHISVRVESRHGRRLTPRKAELHRWRETFAEKLRGWGVDAEATRRPSRGASRAYEPLWRIKARDEGRLRRPGAGSGEARHPSSSPSASVQAWREIARILAASGEEGDRQLAVSVGGFVASMESPDPAGQRAQQAAAGRESAAEPRR